MTRESKTDPLTKSATPRMKEKTCHFQGPPRAPLSAFAAHFPFWSLTCRYHYVTLYRVIAIINSNDSDPFPILRCPPAHRLSRRKPCRIRTYTKVAGNSCRIRTCKFIRLKVL